MNHFARGISSNGSHSPKGIHDRFRRAGWLTLVALVLAPLAPLAGCAGPGYYVQAVSGHLRLMRARVDTAEVLMNAEADRELAAKLRQAEAILEFARSDLRLPESDSYRQVVVTGREAVTWNVVAAPEFAVQPRRWCFPVAGCVPYRGYFERERAEAFAAKRAARGDDVIVSPATAYSTLGWFDDPLLDTMFRYGEAELAALLFHELAHEKLYVPGDTAFNEAYASFVASAGVRRWAEATGRASLAEAWEDRQRANREFSALLARTREALDALYRSPLDEETMRVRKRDLFDDMTAGYERLIETSWSGVDYFGGWMSSGLNNAHLALLEQYRGGDCAFTALFADAGGDFGRFHALAKARSELSDTAREQWLNTPCEAFASTPDL